MKKKKEVKNTQATPCQAGTFAGYYIQVKKNNKWERLNGLRNGEMGVPPPVCHREILSLLGLLGYEQAMALAWWAKAATFKTLELRVVPYKIDYHADAYIDEKNAKQL